MPYKSVNIKLEGLQDRRRKLTDEQKEAIKKEYAQGNVGQRVLAEKYAVSRSTIQLIVNPERAEKVKQRIKEHWKDYSDREQLTKAVRNTRRYKHELYLKGELQVAKE